MAASSSKQPGSSENLDGSKRVIALRLVAYTESHCAEYALYDFRTASLAMRFTTASGGEANFERPLGHVFIAPAAIIPQSAVNRPG